MTGPEDSHSSTRPISVAELLAKNCTIGAPPVGGRRRRRRGNSDSVTVAELTGEIPIISGHDVHDVDDTAAAHRRASHEDEDEHVEATGPVPTTNGVAGHVDEVGPAAEPEFEAESAADQDTDTDDYAGAVADYRAHVEQRDADPDPVEFFAPAPRRPQYTPSPRRFGGPAGRGAEQMSPDPVDEDELFESPVGLAAAPEIADEDTPAAVGEHGNGEPPSYLRSTGGPLFGGQTVADDLARRGPPPSRAEIDLEDHDGTDTAPPSAMSSFLRAAWVVGQCIIAVAFGAGLFIAFDQLWKWNNIIALVLSVLVILGLVVAVRVVRKTEDIGSTLIAVAVGALVTLGPLALLQSG
jgi:hypothetical protein